MKSTAAQLNGAFRRTMIAVVSAGKSATVGRKRNPGYRASAAALSAKRPMQAPLSVNSRISWLLASSKTTGDLGPAREKAFSATRRDAEVVAGHRPAGQRLERDLRYLRQPIPACAATTSRQCSSGITRSCALSTYHPDLHLARAHQLAGDLGLFLVDLE
jgi:hypothetical protein